MNLLLLNHVVLKNGLVLAVSIIVDLRSLFHVSSLTPSHHMSRILFIRMSIIGEPETLLDIGLDILEFLLGLRIEFLDFLGEFVHHIDSLLEIALVSPLDSFLQDLSSLNFD